MFLGQIPIGIGFIIAGAVVYGAQEVSTSDYTGEDIINKLAVISEAVAVSLVAIGIILLFFGIKKGSIRLILPFFVCVLFFIT